MSTDYVTIETPAFPFWIRAAAGLIDSALMGLVCLMFYPLSGTLDNLPLLSSAILAVLNFAYAVPSQSRLWKGQSLGYHLMKIRLVRRDGAYLTVKRAFAKTAMVYLAFSFFTTSHMSIAMYWVPFCLFAAGVDMIFFLFHPQHRMLEDILTDSVVLKVNQRPPVTLIQWDRVTLVLGSVAGAVLVAFYLSTDLISPFEAKDTGTLGQIVKEKTGLTLMHVGVDKKFGVIGQPTVVLEGPLDVFTEQNQDEVLAKLRPVLAHAENFKDDAQVELVLSGIKHTGLLESKFFVHKMLHLR